MTEHEKAHKDSSIEKCLFPDLGLLFDISLITLPVENTPLSEQEESRQVRSNKMTENVKHGERTHHSHT